MIVWIVLGASSQGKNCRLVEKMIVGMRKLEKDVVEQVGREGTLAFREELEVRQDIDLGNYKDMNRQLV